MNWELVLNRQSEIDLDWYQKKDKSLFEKSKKLIEEIIVNPRKGTGKPERLKNCGADEVWSRRISKQDRMVYKIDEKNNTVFIISCREHY